MGIKERLQARKIKKQQRPVETGIPAADRVLNAPVANGRRGVLAGFVGLGVVGVAAACGKDGSIPPGTVSPDGKSYWDGSKYVPMPGMKNEPYITNATPDVTTNSELPVTVEQARDRFAVGPRSRVLGNWSIIDEGPKNHTFKLADATDDTHVRVNTGGFSLDGWVKLNGGPRNPAVHLVVNGAVIPQVDVMGSVFRAVEGEALDKTNSDVFAKGLVTEAKEQPGVISIPVGFRPEGCSTEVTDLGSIRTVEQARDRFGNPDDAFTMDIRNWSVVEYDDDLLPGKIRGFHLNVDPSGKTHRVRHLDGTVFQGYWDIKDDKQYPFFVEKTEGFRAVAFTGNGSVVKEVDSRGLQVWVREDATSADELNQETIHIWKKQKTNEEKPADQGGQPGALDLIFGADPTKQTVC